MREIHDLHVEQSNQGFLCSLRVRQHPITKKPNALLDNERRVWLPEQLEIGRGYLCWVFPNGSSGRFKDYFGLPVEFIDPLHGVALLNKYMRVQEGGPGYEEAVDAMQKVLDGLEEIRPDKILCAEGEFASNHVRDFLRSQGFRKGRPKVELDSICYLGTFPGQDGRFLAQGIGGRVILDRTDQNYIGPMYVSCDVTRAGNDAQGRTYKAFPLPAIDGRLREKLLFRYLSPDRKSKKDPVDQKVREILHA